MVRAAAGRRPGGAQLQGTTLEHAQLQGATLEHAQLQGAYLGTRSCRARS
ncbi:MAG: pentapeptide repeat-containing protein [Defluviicoccus sp.]|nr:MAG: pentapeptide repeat-containing protein [Defluviicoccus sp.]